LAINFNAQVSASLKK